MDKYFIPDLHLPRATDSPLTQNDTNELDPVVVPPGNSYQGGPQPDEFFDEKDHAQATFIPSRNASGQTATVDTVDRGVEPLPLLQEADPLRATGLGFAAVSADVDSLHAPAKHGGVAEGETPDGVTSTDTAPASVKDASETSEVYDAAEIVQKLDTQNYVKVAQKFTDQAEEAGRNDTVTSVYYPNEWPGHAEDAGTKLTVTEREAMHELRDYLGAREQHAQGMLESLTYAGPREVAEATGGFAAYWKSYLAADEGNELCLLAFKGAYGEHKSPSFILNEALKHIPDEALQEYVAKGKLHLDVADITARPENVLIAAVDDLVETGARMRGNLFDLDNNLRPGYHASTEVHLVVAGEGFTKHGIFMGKTGGRVPVKAYYQAHDAPLSEAGTHIATTHSSPKVGIQKELGILDAMNRVYERRPVLARVSPPYREPGWRPERIEYLEQLIDFHLTWRA